MIVCHCYCVSDREIRQCVREGAEDVSDIGRACGAGTGCGGCRPELDQIVAAERGGSSPRIRLSVLLEQASRTGTG